MTAGILSNGRHHGAFGMAGGQPGALGINRVIRVDGSIVELDHIGEAEMAPGDVFEIITPGGGGYGCASQARVQRAVWQKSPFVIEPEFSNRAIQIR